MFHFSFFFGPLCFVHVFFHFLLLLCSPLPAPLTPYPSNTEKNSCNFEFIHKSQSLFRYMSVYIKTGSYFIAMCLWVWIPVWKKRENESERQRKKDKMMKPISWLTNFLVQHFFLLVDYNVIRGRKQHHSSLWYCVCCVFRQKRFLTFCLSQSLSVKWKWKKDRNKKRNSWTGAKKRSEKV